MNKSFLSILITATVLFSACSDELEQNGRIPIVEGDEVNFGANDLVTYGNGHSDFSRSANSRTSYENAYYDESGWHYPLNWVFGDQIKVYCPEAADAVARDYRIEWENGNEGDISPDDNKTAYMVKVDENGLHWGDLDKSHHFHAFYPASAINNDKYFENGVVHGNIPNTQEMIEWKEEEIQVNGQKQTALVGKPNMNYAFMSAHTTIEEPSKANNRVTFDFKPLTTAVEITLQGASSITGGSAPLTAVQISSEKSDGMEKQAVCGDFEHNILTNTTTVHNDNVATDYMITVPLWQKNGEDLVPLELGPNQIVRFTVFLLPGEDSDGKRTLKNLQVRVPGWNTGVRVKYYDNIDLEVGTKSQIWLPDYDTNDKPNTWLGSLPDNVYISQLSIPGSVNAFSSFVNTRGYTEEATEMAQTQTLSVQDQFKYGVRAFEMATERNGSSMGDLVAGDEHSSEDFDYAMKLFADLVAENPTEFVLAIPYYSPTSLLEGGNTENIPVWIEAMRAYINGLPKINREGKQTPAVTASNGEQIPILPFSNTMTIGDARKSILLLTRIATGDQTNPQHTTVIKNWNAARDRWEQRGWTTWTGSGNYVPNPEGSGNNWIYPSEAPASVGTPTYHVQDWMRVCKESKEYEYGTNWPIVGRNKQYWCESKTEKETDIKEFMSETIEVLKNTTNAGDVFINNLSGFYIVDKGFFSADYDGNAGGKMGDVPAFARDMNNLVYEKIMSLDYNSRGPLGIVLINYAGSPDAFGLKMHGDYIVKALVDNNFRFPLLGSSGK